MTDAFVSKQHRQGPRYLATPQVRLYDGMVRFLDRAVEAIDAGDARALHQAVERVFNILIYLHSQLRMDVGETPARALNDFYTAVFFLAWQGFRKQSKTKLLQAIRCIRNVREAWQPVALDPAAQKTESQNRKTIEERIGNAALPQVWPKYDRCKGAEGALSDSYRRMRTLFAGMDGYVSKPNNARHPDGAIEGALRRERKSDIESSGFNQ